MIKKNLSPTFKTIFYIFFTLVGAVERCWC